VPDAPIPQGTASEGSEQSRSVALHGVWVPNPWLIVAGALLFLMLFVPTAYRPAKIVLLGLVLAGVVASVLRSGRIFLHRSIVRWTLVMVVTGVCGIVIGVLNGAPGALRVSTVYVFWPMLFTLLASGIRRPSTVDGLMRVLVLATFAIGVYSLSFVLFRAGWFPGWLYIELDQGQEIGFYAGFIEFNLYSIASLFFLVPFSLAALLTWRRSKRPPVSRRWLWISLALGLMAALLSGRRALWLILALSPLIILAFYLRLPRRHLRFRPRTVLLTASTVGLVIAVLLFALPYAYAFSMSSVLANLREAFDAQADSGASVRQEQFRALLNGWLANPVFGAGHGASAAAFGSVRSEDQPWSYELYYVALLYQTGLFGFLIYSAGVLWIFRLGFRIIRGGKALGLHMVPVLSGMTCFLMATATNPYLAKFDCLWVIFVPVALINYWLLQRPDLSKTVRVEFSSPQAGTEGSGRTATQTS
jgi:O-antigen ligase